MYHQVGPFAPPPKLSSNFCHVAQFARQMRWLSRLPFRVVPLRVVTAQRYPASATIPMTCLLNLPKG